MVFFEKNNSENENGMMFFLSKNRLKLLLYSWVLYGGSIFLYTFVPFYINLLQSSHYHFLVQKTLLCLLVLYSIFIVFFKKDFLLKEERSYQTLISMRTVLRSFVFPSDGRYTLSEGGKVSLRLFFVKFFFIPLMSIFALSNCMDIVRYKDIFSLHISPATIFYQYYPLLLSLIFFIDTVYFFVAYIVESRSFDNIVVSVESTAFGWIIALICYPPFIQVSNNFLGWHSQNFSNFGNISVNIFMGGISLCFMLIYLWATISLGTKASNLTNRGIVSRGAYAFVRHPAYVAKNLAWWIMGIPLIFSPEIRDSFVHSTLLDFLTNDLMKMIVPLLSLSAWSMVYYLRAITEERHLSRDSQYRLYMKKVQYRFIPGIV